MAVEVVVACRIASVVAAVGPDLLAGYLALAAQTLVDEVPDVSALVGWILTHEVPILFESTDGVTHSVCVFTLDEWAWVVVL